MTKHIQHTLLFTIALTIAASAVTAGPAQLGEMPTRAVNPQRKALHSPQPVLLAAAAANEPKLKDRGMFNQEKGAERIFLTLNPGRLPAGTVLTNQFAKKGLLLSARSADGDVQANMIVKSSTAENGRTYFWLELQPRLTGGIGVFDIVVAGSTNSAKATYFKCFPELQHKGERVDLVGLEKQTGKIIARASFQSDSESKQHRALEIFGEFDRVEIRPSETVRFVINDFVDVVFK